MGSGPDDADPPPGEQNSTTTGISTTATLGKVTGKLDRDRRASLRRQVTETFDTWVDGAYLSGDGADAFASFSKDAARLARGDQALMSNAGMNDGVASVTATSRNLAIEVLADRGRPVGVTGRFVLVLELDGQARRTDRIVGRLLMRRGGGGWLVFGYDVKRGQVG